MFIQVITAPCSRAEDVKAVHQGWREELGPGAVGFLGGTFGVTDDGLFIGVVRFESEEAARKNEGRPEQDAWAAKMAAVMDGPATFDDYTDVTTFLAGGSDDAGFVQVIRGTVDDIEGAKALVSDPGDLPTMRPEVIGGTFAVKPDGSYTQTVAFTSEAAAREGEQQEPPAEVREQMEKFFSNATFHDLHDPWFVTL
ncbi:MAG: hypothetical protein J7518_14010 [Nocardioidaceae bacterium]|nr:hypothetical protein [Nocardioidaceae bacterium]